ncbi:MAG: sigma-70 family RNA polymerase sigma factor [Bacteroidaceae bacterium]|nr:sigma-70 family RNA polymerase sigma factor [Bacteroidaceae bacterium]MBR3442645.1 sigma-70 family RNA polymerase sigma factor [Bacteroidaceae bacterium]
MNDRQIVDALLRHDAFVTRLFFYRNLRPLLLSLIQRLGRDGQRWEYDEMVNELYALLLADDGRRLRTFTFSCSLYQWLKVVALHHLTAKTDSVVIDSVSKEPLYERAAEEETVEADSSAREDVERLLSQMPNQRYATVLRRLTLEGYSNEELAREMDVNIANLYNIKRRAMAQLSEVALKDKLWASDTPRNKTSRK